MGKKTLICSAALVLVSALTGAAFGQGIKDSFSAGLPGNSPISLPEGKSLSGGSAGQRLVGKFSPGFPEITVESMSVQKTAGLNAESQSDIDYGVQFTKTGRSKRYTDWSPDGKWIAYDEYGDDGLLDIWIIPAEGGEPINLTPDIEGHCFFPGFSPDSKEVTFSHYTDPQDVSTWDIYSVNIETKEYYLFLSNAINGFWSNAGQYFVYRIADTSELAISYVALGATWILTEGDGSYSIACFTPDDSYVITSVPTESGMKLFTTPVEGGGLEQLTYDIDNHWYPNVSPDGQWILYTNFTDSYWNDYVNLYAYNTITGESLPVFTEIPTSYHGASFSHDGSKFSYILAVDGVYELYVAPFPFESEPPDYSMYGSQLTFGYKYKWYTDWSPDGKWITFTQPGTDGLLDVWIIPAEGGTPVNLTPNIEGRCFFPNFTADSQEVTFAHYTDSKDVSTWDIYSVNIETKESYILLSNAINGFWSHNGRFFAYRIADTFELAVFDTKSGDIRVIAPGDGLYGLSCFTPDNRYIITTLADEDGWASLFRIPFLDLSTDTVNINAKPEQLTFQMTAWYPNVSSDGRWLLFTEFAEKNLYAYSLENGDLMRVFPDLPYMHYCGSFSPDGRKLSFLLDVEGTYQLFTEDFPYWEEPQGPELIFKFPTADWVDSSPAIDSGGTIYIVSGNTLYAINPNGFLKWEYQTDGGICSSPVIDSDSTIYIVSMSLENYLYAINLDGSLKWKFQTDFWLSSSPAIGSDGTIYIGSTENYVYAINPDGSLKWEFNEEDSIGISKPIVDNSLHKLAKKSDIGSPSIAIGSNGTIYYGSNQNLYAINPDGSFEWKCNANLNGWMDSSPAIDKNGTIYIGSWDYNLYAINPDGFLKWKYKTDEYIKSSPSIGSDGTIYFGSMDHYIYALNNEGSLKWNYQTDEGIESSPSIGSDGTIYIGSSDRNLYAINPDGSLKWKYQTDDFIWSSPTLGSNGIIYFGSGDYLYAIDSGTGTGLADSPWPKFRHDNRNTGSAPQETFIDITAPDGGETLIAGEYYDITWESTGTAKGRIEFSSDGGSTWKLVADKVDASEGWFGWEAVPDVESDDCYIRITGFSPTGVSLIEDWSDEAFSVSPAPFLRVITPNGGENWEIGQTYAIKWEARNVAEIRIAYSTDDGGTWTRIERYVDATTGSYSWTIPDDFVPSEKYRIRIVDEAETDTASESYATFTIAKPVEEPFLRVISPNGGEEWIAGETYPITWEARNVKTVSISFLPNNLRWLVIATGIDATAGSYDWTLPETPVENCRIRVADESGSQVYSQSYAVFAIVATVEEPYLQIKSPNGGEKWDAGKTYQITWESSNLEAVKIGYSTNKGSTWINISDGYLAETGSFDWTVPDEPSDQCIVRLEDAEISTGPSSKSNAVFTIVRPVVEPHLKLTSPNGGEELEVLKEFNITWEAQNIGTVSLFYATDGGSFWKKIATGIDASTGSFTWRVPDDPSTDCRILIVNESNSDMYSFSENPFSILRAFDEPWVRVIAPNNGEKWRAGDEYDIVWEPSGKLNLTIRYSLDGGSSWKPIATDINSDDRYYTWAIPHEIQSEQCKIWVGDTGYAKRFDSSDGVFTILPSSQEPFVDVTYPDGGEYFGAGDILGIDWNSALVSTVNIDISGDGGQTWISVEKYIQASDGSYDWTIPDDVGSLDLDTEQCLIRITDTSNADITDMSDEPFTIYSVFIDLTYPGGGETLKAGEILYVEWDSEGVETVNIYLTLDGGNEWNIIGEEINADNGYYEWMIPNDYNSNQCYIRIISVDHDDLDDVSEEAFTIRSGGTGLLASDYFPMEEGITWTWQSVVKDQDGNVVDSYEYSQTMAGTTVVDGETYWVISEYEVPDNLFRIENNIVYMYMGDAFLAKTHAKSQILQVFEIPIFDFNQPQGGTWPIYSMSDSGEGYSQSITINGRFLGTEDVQVPAGSYTNCAVFRTVMNTEYTSGSGADSYTYGYDTISTSWIAPDTGSVRSVYNEKEFENNELVYDATTTDMLTDFTFEGAFIELLSPAGGEQWAAGSRHAITWKSTGVSQVSIGYTVDAGSSWEDIATNIDAAAGSFDWLVPEHLESEECYVYVQETGNEDLADANEEPFTIYIEAGEPYVELLSPNGGQRWTGGTTQTITWTSTAVDMVRLEYSTDGGINWKLIIESTDASKGSYAWTVPDVPSDNCKVKVSDVSDLNRYDESDDPFEILKALTNENALFVLDTNLETAGYQQNLPVGEVGPGDPVGFAVYAGDWLTTSTARITMTWDPAQAAFTYILVSMDGRRVDINGANIILPAEENVLVGSGGTVILDNTEQSKGTITVTLTSASNLTAAASVISSGLVLFAAFETSSDFGPEDNLVVDVNVNLSDKSGTAYDLGLRRFRAFARKTLLSVTTPAGGDELQGGEPYDITWTSEGISKIRIEFTAENDKNWVPIAEDVDANTGRHETILPDVTSTECRVRIIKVDDDAVLFTSDLFTISGAPTPTPIITVISPNGGEQWVFGEPQTIEWTSENVPEVSIAISWEGGTEDTFYWIVQNIDAQLGSYELSDWTTFPDIDSQDCFIAVVQSDNVEVVDYNNEPFSITPGAVEPSLELTKPSGGERWVVGSTQRIEWNARGISNIEIVILYEGWEGDGPFWLSEETKNIDASLGYYDWTVTAPDYYEYNDCYIGIRQVDNTAFNDFNIDPFTIYEEPFIDIVLLEAGEEWEVRSEQWIFWDSASIDKVKIEYSTDNGVTYKVVESGYTDWGAYVWTVPDDVSNECKIRVSDASNPDLYDVSETFSIVKGNFISVTEPDKGRNWAVGAKYEIKWVFEGVTNVKIELTIDNGVNWEEIETDVSAAAGSHSWEVPDRESNQCKIRITDVSDTSIFGESGIFTISMSEIQIQHTPIATKQILEEITFTAQVTSNVDIKQVTLYWDETGDRIFDNILDMASSGEDIYSATLKAGIFPKYGIEYYINALDNEGKEARTPVDEGFHSINAIISVMRSNQTVRGGTAETAYRMVSIPLILSEKNIENQLLGKLPEGERGPDWRLFWYNPEKSTWGEYPNIPGFTPGTAYWIIATDDYELSATDGTTVTAEDFSIKLFQGWSDIANPWQFNISWKDVYNPGGEVPVIWRYEGKWIGPNTTDTIEPWKGYSVFCYETSLIYLQPKSASVDKPVAYGGGADWKLSIKATAGLAEDSANHLGVRADASNEWDKYDHVEPPPVGDYVSVLFPHRDWMKYPYDYTVDFRPPAETVSWDFDVKTNITRERVSVELEGVDELPEGYSLFVIDHSSGKPLDLNGTAFDFTSESGLTERRFTLVVTTDEEIGSQDHIALPEQFITASSYPNPFNPQTIIRYRLSMPGLVKINVFNAVGQNVREYDLGYRGTGIHELVFDAVELTTGLYIYRIESGNASVTEKMLYMK